MTNFVKSEMDFFSGMKMYFENEWGHEKVSKFRITICVLFNIPLTVFKNIETWGPLASTIKMNASSFQREITKFIDVLSPIEFKHMVTGKEKICSMVKMIYNYYVFKNFPVARYATDVILQQKFRRSGSVQEVEYTTVENTICMATKRKYLLCQMALSLDVVVTTLALL